MSLCRQVADVIGPSFADSAASVNSALLVPTAPCLYIYIYIYTILQCLCLQMIVKPMPLSVRCAGIIPTDVKDAVEVKP